MKKITFLILTAMLFPLYASSQCFVKIGCGDGNVIAQKSDGTLWAWGLGLGCLGSGW